MVISISPPFLAAASSSSVYFPFSNTIAFASGTGEVSLLLLLLGVLLALLLALVLGVLEAVLELSTGVLWGVFIVELLFFTSGEF